MVSQLKEKALSGFFWTFSERISVQLVSFVISVVLARSLAPHDFGLVAMITVFLNIAAAIADSGLRHSLLRSKEFSPAETSSVFYINVTLSLAIYGVLCLVAPFISVFFNEVQITSLIRVLGLIVVINSFSLIQNTYLDKILDFKTQMLVRFPSVVIGGILGIFMAVYGYGVWSIVAQRLATSLSAMIQLWIRSSWRPIAVLDKESVRKHFAFGVNIMTAGIINQLFENLYSIVIGKFFSATDLGFYTRAKSLKELPSKNIGYAINKVSYPVFAQLQDNEDLLRRSYSRLLKQVSFWVFPLMIMAIVLAMPLIRFLFTEKWLPAVPYFQWLCIVGMIYPLTSFNLNVVNARGKSALFLRVEVIKKIILVVLISLTLKYGILWLIYSHVAFAIIEFFMNAYFAGRVIHYPLQKQLRDILPVIWLNGFIFALLSYGNNKISWSGDLIQLLTVSVTGGILYLLLAFAFRFTAIQEIKRIIASKIRK